MHSFFLRVACISFSLFFFAVPAVRAAVVPVDLGFAQYSIGGTVANGNINLQSYAPNTGPFYSQYDIGVGHLTLLNAEIVTGNDKGALFQHVRPSGVGPQDNYLAVYGRSGFGFLGAAIFDFSSNVTNFAFNWGSIDSYNWLSVTNSENRTYTITGADIMASMAGIKEGKTSKYFSLTDIAGIVRVVLRSCSDSFEVANISAVPLPAALPLLGASVIGLVVLRRRRTSSV